MSQAWYKVDNVAKVFLATTTRRDPRVFRISCTLTEEVEPDTLNEALRRTAGGVAPVPGHTAPGVVLALF